MDRITTPTKPKEAKSLFTEGIDYFATGKTSIWGQGDRDTVQLLKKFATRGRWLNLAAGDGRYNLALLKRADFVVAADADQSALSKLWHSTPVKYRGKLSAKVLDLTQAFPFADHSFNGVFCTGTLHLFSKKILRQVISQIDRVLRPNGKVILDFATDVQRIMSNDKSLVFGREPLYTLGEAKAILKDLFRDYQITLHTSKVTENVPAANPPYTLHCRFIILVADKKSQSHD